MQKNHHHHHKQHFVNCFETGSNQQKSNGCSNIQVINRMLLQVSFDFSNNNRTRKVRDILFYVFHTSMNIYQLYDFSINAKKLLCTKDVRNDYYLFIPDSQNKCNSRVANTKRCIGIHNCRETISE